MTELFRAHWPTVVGYLRRRTGDPVLAEELAQETFAKATAAFLGWRGGPPAAWLLAIARNVLTDHHRRGRRVVPLDETLLPAQAFPDSSVEVRDLLDRLPAATRRLLALAYLDGFTHAEIGAMTGQTPAAVRSAVWRARDAFRVVAAERTDDER
jgi:RNA polymerase sigma-70 factor (ECF subfamily)